MSRPLVPTALARAIGALTAVGSAVAIALLVPAESACSLGCPSADTAFGGGERFTAGTDLVYETAPLDGTYLPFNGGTLFHVHHGLGITPYSVEVTLSFAAHPEGQGNGGSALGAGNQAIVLAADANEVQIKNDTCADYYVRVVVRANAFEQTPAADAGTDAAADGDTP